MKNRIFSWLKRSLRPDGIYSISPPETFSFETITLDRRGTLLSRTAGQAQQITQSLPGGVRLDLVEVPAGSFQMGSRREGGYEDERPLHPVFLEGFWMGKHPVTQAQWQAVMGKPPACRFHGGDLPVENICWKEAAAFCERLAQITSQEYQLPSEAQWEYACRSGTASPFSLGETITTEFANYVGAHTYRDEPPGIYRHGTTPAGSFPPNPWGLYDMHGNVWEFCADFWSPDYTGAPVDGSPQAHGFHPERKEVLAHAARGGSWHETPNHCRSAMRLKVDEEERMEFYGLRVMLQKIAIPQPPELG
ncbi:MAG: formylglycine-generating enzyme family protein [Anaerolineaceae bacterium]|nr:formylglycine-generating enzyme family protein [Anaerolineaceae bacterium]